MVVPQSSHSMQRPETFIRIRLQIGYVGVRFWPKCMDRLLIASEFVRGKRKSLICIRHA